MPGYSGTPLATKLGIKDGHRVALLGAPDGFEGLLAGLPARAGVARRLGASGADVILLFAADRAVLDKGLARAASGLDPSGGLWICWPKKSSGVATDLGEADVREAGLGAGLVDNKVCAVTEVWSGLRFVVRLEDRPGAPAKRGGTGGAKGRTTGRGTARGASRR